MHYRLWQFWQIVRAKPLTTTAWAEVTAVLTPTELQLFTHFPANDQWHSLRVLRLVQSSGCAQPALWKAALLHDVGKTQVRLTLLDRVVVVMGGWLWPRRTAVWGNGAARGWRRPFVVKTQHPAWGAAMAEAAGCDALTISLIARHQDALADVTEPDQQELLRILQWADDQS
ncbi:MAG TPA: HD domain-containing protein [Chloroflexota bacterium]|nr:HD domain-containing protein [Chloroflexota bacterium]